MWTTIAEHISEVTGEKLVVENRRSVGGGCINQGYVIGDRNRTYFVKLNQASEIDMFAAEALGLKEMWSTETIRVPQPICYGTADNSAYIVQEYLELGRSGGNHAWSEMGRNLAAMHKATSNQGFGWERNNTIGSTPQINTWTSDWVEFFAEHRISYQLKLAKRRGGQFSQGESLIKAITKLLANHHPQPSLVHGDLWSGNASVTAAGEPVIFDPATYYGDREVDIAMTELFGRFPASFYQGYNAVWPLDSGYELRKTLYNLYHIINHFNLFGGSYESQANSMISQLLSKV
ncbi:fructosamine kinase family protein [Phormidium sp. LEGE 05292]|uniref:fructosamine kinase family protein n=1 Tax=[Phormidium] sp. LEGE 05292 TaxID=767427 RepID=UPI0018829CE6|nr:fructosamine kinase family protein [Phormidium sp. LEGE 05292]MBE9226103.1 fructosamine kinase family protein [Phormidium sp. LEGE 05292]